MPSSPNGPCRMGRTTSTAPSAAGAARSGSAASAPRRGRAPAAPAAGGSAQRAVAADLDRLRLVALRVERLDDRARRRERDLVLARASAGEHGDAERARVTVSSAASVVVVVSVGVVGGRRRRRHVDCRRTASRPCSDPAGCCPADPARSRRRRTSRRRCPAGSPSTLKPAAFSVAFASASVWPVTSGSGVVCGPFETERLTVEPLRRRRRAARHLADDDPGRLVALDVRAARRRSLRPGAAAAPSSSRGRRRAARRPASGPSSS